MFNKLSRLVSSLNNSGGYKIKVKLMKIILLIFLFSAITFSQSEDVINGNWWLKQETKNDKLTFLLGFVSGKYGELEIILDLLPKTNPYKISRDSIIIFSAAEFRQVQNISRLQIIDGLDSIYSDYKNRRIKILHAIEIVTKQINGFSEEEITKLLNKFRKNDI